MALMRTIRPIHRLLLALSLLIAGSGAGFAIWKQAQPAPKDQFGDLTMEEHERWLQDLGYSD